MQPTRFRFTTAALERLHFPKDAPTSLKGLEFSDVECPGLKLSVSRTGKKTFWLRYTLHGTKQALRLGTFPSLSVADARKDAWTLRAQVDQGLDPKEQTPAHVTFADYAKDYLAFSQQTKRSYADDASKLKCWMLPALGQTRLQDLKRKHVEAYLLGLRKTHSAASVNRHLTLLSAMLKRAVWLELLERNPCTGVTRLKEAGPRQQTLSPQQAVQLLDALTQERNQTAACALALILYTGTRKQECLQARWEHVDLERQVWTLPKTKSGKVQHVHLSNAALELLRNLPSKDKSAWLFPGQDPSKPLADPRKALARALQRMDMPASALCIHGLRHAHASIMVGSGRRTLAEAQHALRHASSHTTQAYVHLSSESAKAAVQSVDDAIEQARRQLVQQAVEVERCEAVQSFLPKEKPCHPAQTTQ